MTPAAFAKLALRMMPAGMLFIYIPSKALLSIPFIISTFASGSITDTVSLFMTVIFVAMTIASLIVWFQADRLALTLLPSGASPEQGVEYAQWQRWGLVFFGGWSALNACLNLENFIIDPAFNRSLLPVMFNLIAAIILIAGWDNLTHAFFKKWRTV